ncbi:hypothetical protein F511_27390 [Dorcoceras hygrometricum]|uniref:Uncharacterized protein n=1 Tax=Dorcoceras hygrometricum TaxID=472368 RepID=A0A2Z7BJ69_9LAMI|nr:hypothetical protein F511_27390 [Dorcoceras hygrometricum]
MVKRLATSRHDPLGITDSACKNQLVVVSIQYGPFYTYISIRSTTIGKSRVARDPIAMHTSWRSNSDIASVTSIGYPRMKVSGESSTTKHRLLHASGPHPIPPPNDPKSDQSLSEGNSLEQTRQEQLKEEAQKQIKAKRRRSKDHIRGSAQGPAYRNNIENQARDGQVKRTRYEQYKQGQNGTVFELKESMKYTIIKRALKAKIGKSLLLKMEIRFLRHRLQKNGQRYFS